LPCSYAGVIGTTTPPIILVSKNRILEEFVVSRVMYTYMLYGLATFPAGDIKVIVTLINLIQWNPPNIGPLKCVLIREVSSNTDMLYEAGTWSSDLFREVTCLGRCPRFRGVL